MRSSAVVAGMLLALWVLAWGSASWANVISGVVVVGLLLLAVPDARGSGRRVVVRPVPLARLAGHYLRDVVVANLQLAREVLRPRLRLSTAIVRVPLPGCSPEMLTAIANLVAMTPGEAPIEVEADPPVLYVHVLQFTSVDEVRGEIWRLRDQVLAAFGSDEAIEAARRASGPASPGEEAP
jgi:multicomponent Na+:H+ antiporter subunit E